MKFPAMLGVELWVSHTADGFGIVARAAHVVRRPRARWTVGDPVARATSSRSSGCGTRWYAHSPTMGGRQRCLSPPSRPEPSQHDRRRGSSCGDEGNRTLNPRLAKAVLCQLSYVPGRGPVRDRAQAGGWLTASCQSAESVAAAFLRRFNTDAAPAAAAASINNLFTTGSPLDRSRSTPA